MQKPIKIGLAILSSVVVILIITLIIAKFQQKTLPVALPVPPTIQPPTDMPASQPPIDTTSTDDISNWKTYRNDKYGFELKYPTNANISANDLYAQIVLTLDKESNLKEKSVWIDWKHSTLNCSNPMHTYVSDTKNIVIKGVNFKREESGLSGTRHAIGYSTIDNGRCIQLDFILQASSKDKSVKKYDPAEEWKVFDQILSTFKFTNSFAITPCRKLNQSCQFYSMELSGEDNCCNGLVCNASRYVEGTIGKCIKYYPAPLE